MVFCWLFYTAIALYFFIPEVLEPSQMVFQNIIYGFFSDATTFLTQSGINNSFFDTSAQVLAAFLAIIFSISLFVMEMNSEKYSQKIKNYYSENPWTKRTLAWTLFTIFVCIICIFFNIQNTIIGILVILFLIINVAFFYKYYIEMMEIIDPYKFADILRKNCIDSAIEEKTDIYENIMASFVDMIIKTIIDKDNALSQKYIDTIEEIIIEINGSNLSASIKLELQGIIFYEVARALQYSINETSELRMSLNGLLFTAIQLEIKKR